jgi:hypothetical protein
MCTQTHPRHESDTTLQDRTPPREDASDGKVQDVAVSHVGATVDELEGGEMDVECPSTSQNAGQ